MLDERLLKDMRLYSKETRMEAVPRHSHIGLRSCTSNIRMASKQCLMLVKVIQAFEAVIQLITLLMGHSLFRKRASYMRQSCLLPRWNGVVRLKEETSY